MPCLQQRLSGPQFPHLKVRVALFLRVSSSRRLTIPGSRLKEPCGRGLEALGGGGPQTRSEVPGELTPSVPSGNGARALHERAGGCGEGGGTHLLCLCVRMTQGQPDLGHMETLSLPTCHMALPVQVPAPSSENWASRRIR